jgi:hypothetical protein
VVALDGWQTSRPGREVGTPWLYGTNPHEHQVKLGVILGGEVIVSVLAGRALKHTRLRRVWWAPQALVLGAHTRGVIDNFRWGQY